MRGASALEAVLADHPAREIRAFVVWEPVLWTDVAPPRDGVLALLQDARGRQYWDPDKLLSSAWVAATQAAPGAWNLEQGLSADTVVWDVVALYPPGPRWEQHPPAPQFAGYPVVDALDGLRRELGTLVGSPPRP